MDLEEIIFEIITYSGEAKSYAYEALDYAKKKNNEGFNESINKSEESLLKAHKAHTKVLFESSNNENFNISLLLIHAEDQFMSAMDSKDLIKSLAEIMFDKYEK